MKLLFKSGKDVAGAPSTTLLEEVAGAVYIYIYWPVEVTRVSTRVSILGYSGDFLLFGWESFLLYSGIRVNCVLG